MKRNSRFVPFSFFFFFAFFLSFLFQDPPSQPEQQSTTKRKTMTSSAVVYEVNLSIKEEIVDKYLGENLDRFQSEGTSSRNHLSDQLEALLKTLLSL